MSLRTKLGTRKNPTRLRLWLIAIVVFVLALVWLNAVNSSSANALPVAGCSKDGKPIDCRDRFDSGPFSREGTEKLRKYGGTVVIGCAGGFAAASGPGAVYGCSAATLAALWDTQF